VVASRLLDNWKFTLVNSQECVRSPKCMNVGLNPMMLDTLTVTLQMKKTLDTSSSSSHFLRFRESYSFA
jgi:hypothetical protein